MRDNDDKWLSYKPTPDGFEYTVRLDSVSDELTKEQDAWDIAQAAIAKAMRK